MVTRSGVGGCRSSHHALITKEVESSLFIGIVSGALLYTSFNPITTIDAALTEALIPAVSDTAGIFIFLVELGILVALINRAGGSAAFGKWAQTHIKTRVGAILATFVLGVLIFVDDYFNCLTVGSVMRPVTDAHKVSRAKLSYDNEIIRGRRKIQSRAFLPRASVDRQGRPVGKTKIR